MKNITNNSPKKAVLPEKEKREENNSQPITPEPKKQQATPESDAIKTGLPKETKPSLKKQIIEENNEQKDAGLLDKKIQSGDELPHQKDGLRPEDIIEIEQEPLEMIITEEDKKSAPSVPPNQLITSHKEAGPEEKFVPTPQLEDEVRQSHQQEKKLISAHRPIEEPADTRVLEDKPAVKPLKPTTPSALSKPKLSPSQPQVSFTARFLDKLKELRQQANQKRRENMEKNLAKIMEYARQEQKVTNDDVERITGVSDRQALNYLKKLVKAGKLVRFGKKRNVFYKPVEK